MELSTIPPELATAIGSEAKDFSVKAGRVQPVKKSLSVMLHSVVIIVFVVGFFSVLFNPVLQGEKVALTVNGEEVLASLENIGVIILPAIIVGFFALLGVGLFLHGLRMLFKKGGYFVGTPTRLICFESGKIRSIDWEAFSGDIEVSGNSSKGNVLMKMREGRMKKRKNGPDQFVPYVIEMCCIPNAFEIEAICRKRIKESDVTPANSAQGLDN